MEALGSRVIWEVVNGVYEWLVILRAGYSQKKNEVFIATLINNGSFVYVKWVSYSEKLAKPSAVLFSSKVPLCYIVTTEG